MSKICDCNQGRLPCTCKEALPPPPPMRGQAKKSDASSIVFVIMFALMFGVMAGWQMHGGVCS